MLEKIFALIGLFTITYYMERFMFGDLRKMRKPTRAEYVGQYILSLVLTFVLLVVGAGIVGWILGAW